MIFKITRIVPINWKSCKKLLFDKRCCRIVISINPMVCVHSARVKRVGILNVRFKQLKFRVLDLNLADLNHLKNKTQIQAVRASVICFHDKFVQFTWFYCNGYLWPIKYSQVMKWEWSWKQKSHKHSSKRYTVEHLIQLASIWY